MTAKTTGSLVALIAGGALLSVGLVSQIAAAAAPVPPAPRTDPLAGLAIHHVQISVKDADSLAAWYVETLGFRITKRIAGASFKIVWIDIPGFRLGLAQISGSTREASASIAPPADVMKQGYRQIHFSVANVDTAYRALIDKGVKFAIAPTSYTISGIRLATLCDPEGNVISLYQDVDPANPPVGKATLRSSGDKR